MPALQRVLGRHTTSFGRMLLFYDGGVGEKVNDIDQPTFDTDKRFLRYIYRSCTSARGIGGCKRREMLPVGARSRRLYGVDVLVKLMFCYNGL